MKLRNFLSGGFFALTLLMFCQGPSADAACNPTDTSFTINDIDPPLKCDPGTSLDIGNGGAEYDIGGGKKIKIVPVSTSGTPAFPQVYYDEASDVIIMRNAKITTSTPPIDNVKFKFWRVLSSLQDGGGTNPVDYSISAAGLVYHYLNGQPYNSIQSRGWVNGILLGNLTYPPPTPADCLYVLVRCTTTGANSAASFTSANHNVTQSLTFTQSSRELRGEFWIHLSNDNDAANARDYVQLSQAYGMKVKYGPPGDVTACPECPACCPAVPVWWFVVIIILLSITIFRVWRIKTTP